MGGPDPEVNLGRGGPREGLVRTHVSVVKESGREPPLKISPGQWLQEAEIQGLFQRPPEPFHDGDGPRPADGAEALTDAERLQTGSEDLGCKLRPLIRDKVAGGAVGANGLVDERRHGVGGGLGQEHLGGERHAGEDVDHDSEFEREDPKETGDLGQIGHPYMVRPSSLYAARCGSSGSGSGMRFSFRTLATVRGETFQPALASVGRWCRCLRNPFRPCAGSGYGSRHRSGGREARAR